MFLTGVLQALVVLLQAVFFNVFVRFATIHYSLNGILFACICGVAASFVLLTYAGPGKLGLSSMKNWATWAYGFCGLAQFSLDIYLVHHVSATELSLFSRISIPVAIILTFIFLKRKPNKQDLFAVASIILGAVILLYLQDAEKLKTIVTLVILIAIFRSGEFLSTEVHNQSVNANQNGNMRDRARVVGFASFTSSMMFLLTCFIISLNKDHLIGAWPMVEYFPNLADFGHLPTIILATLYGVFITAFARFCIWSATFKIKTENLLAILVLVPASTFAVEYIISLIFSIDHNFALLEGERGNGVLFVLVLMTVGSLVSIIPKVTKNILRKEGQSWLQAVRQSLKQQAANYEIEHDVLGSSDYNILQQTLVFFDRDFKKVAKIYGLTEDSVKVVLASRGSSCFTEKISKKVHKVYQEEIVIRDKLTHAKNRIAFSIDINELITKEDQFSLILLDLNDFKPVNDKYGHDAGDVVLVKTVKRLENLFSNKVYRLGGDEFVLLKSKPVVRDDIAKIKEAISRKIAYKNHTLKIGTSLGIAEFKKDGLTQDELLEFADKNLYKDKENK